MCHVAYAGNFVDDTHICDFVISSDDLQMFLHSHHLFGCCVLICFCHFHALFDLQGPVLLMPLEAMKMFTERKLFVFLCVAVDGYISANNKKS